MIENFIAGDTINFTQHYTDYPSDDYNALFYLNGASLLSISGSASTTSNPDHAEGAFLFTITANQGAYLKSGTYAYAVRVTSGSINYTAESGNITVLPNIALQQSKESICNRMIELIEKSLLNQLSSGEAAESISIAGRSISMMNRRDLLVERSFWDRERKALINARLGKSGIKQLGIII
jgi:hypothetical protein